MNDALEQLSTALNAPVATLVDRRVPKSKVVEAAGLTAVDRRALEDGVERIGWRATLRPASVGVPAFTDEVRDYAEIVVLTAELRDGPKPARLAEILHRAISAPVVLVLGDARSASLSIGLKRRHEREAGRAVVEWFALSPTVPAAPDAVDDSFLNSLDLTRIPAPDLFALHVALSERAEALAAARATGAWRLPKDEAEAERRREALAALDAERREVARLRRAAATEKRLARRIDLSHEVARAEAQLSRTLALLT